MVSLYIPSIFKLHRQMKHRPQVNGIIMQIVLDYIFRSLINIPLTFVNHVAVVAQRHSSSAIVLIGMQQHGLFTLTHPEIDSPPNVQNKRQNNHDNPLKITSAL